MRVLLSIKPEYAEKIFAEEKRFEYRRKIYKRDISSVLVYVTAPVKRILGEFSVRSVYSGTPEFIWMRTKYAAGIDRDFFDKYFSGVSVAHAICIGAVHRFPRAIDPRTVEPEFTAPQSYRYINWIENFESEQAA